MANVVRSLTVDLRTRTAKFDQGMDKSAKTLKGFRTSVSQTGNALIRFNALLATAAGVGFGALIKRSIDLGDQVQKLSIRLGASTEALSQYRFVAERSGVTFETFTMGLQRMTRRVAEAANGTGEARDALKELGLSAVDLNRQTPEQAFERIADAMQTVELQSDRVRLAMKLFDSEGVSLLQTMEGGAAGILALREEADALGLTLTKDVADRMAKAKDATSDFNAAVQGLGNTLAITFAESIASAINNVTELMRVFNMASDISRRGVFPGGQPPGPGGVTPNVSGDPFVEIRVEDDPEVKLLDLRAEKMRELSIIAMDMETEITERARIETEARIRIARFEATVGQQIKRRQVSELSQFFQALAGRSKAAAIAAIALNKGLAIAKVVQDTEVAAMQARTSQIVPGDPSSLARGEAAAQGIRAAGRLSIGIIAATGLAQASGIGGGGGGGGGGAAPGTPGNPISTTDEGLSSIAFDPRPQTSITFIGDFYGFDDFEERVTEAIQNADGRDVVVLAPNGRTASGIREVS